MRFVMLACALTTLACRDEPVPAIARGGPAPAPSATPPARRSLERPARAAAAPPASASSFYAATFARTPTSAELAALGAQMFRDRGLSASGHLACASCHDPDHAFGPPGDQVVPPGGVSGRDRGARAAPSLRYLQHVPPFDEHFHDSDDNDAVDQGAAGGYTWDGRAASAHAQALAPLLSPVEMANASEDDLAARVRAAPYANELRARFGTDALATTASAVKAVTWALEVYQQDPALFYPYDSKYDAVIHKRATLGAREAHGKELFDDPAKGNCASCHPDAITSGVPVFTDYGFVALGVPRNRALAADADPAFYDLGLCGPYRTDLATHGEYCGKFRTPSLRNVATRKRFFHNGALTSLRDVVAFYATRDVTPRRWYAHGDPYDDLPARYRENLTRDPPFGGHPGDRPALGEPEIADIVAFLGTLSDGYRP